VREFTTKAEAVEYARATGLPLGKRQPGKHLAALLPPYVVGRFCAYHYKEIPLDKKSAKLSDPVDSLPPRG